MFDLGPITWTCIFESGPQTLDLGYQMSYLVGLWYDIGWWALGLLILDLKLCKLDLRPYAKPWTLTPWCWTLDFKLGLWSQWWPSTWAWSWAWPQRHPWAFKRPPRRWVWKALDIISPGITLEHSVKLNIYASAHASLSAREVTRIGKDCLRKWSYTDFRSCYSPWHI